MVAASTRVCSSLMSGLARSAAQTADNWHLRELPLASLADPHGFCGRLAHGTRDGREADACEQSDAPTLWPQDVSFGAFCGLREYILQWAPAMRIALPFCLAGTLICVGCGTESAEGPDANDGGSSIAEGQHGGRQEDQTAGRSGTEGLGGANGSGGGGGVGGIPADGGASSGGAGTGGASTGGAGTGGGGAGVGGSGVGGSGVGGVAGGTGGSGLGGSGIGGVIDGTGGSGAGGIMVGAGGASCGGVATECRFRTLDVCASDGFCEVVAVGRCVAPGLVLDCANQSPCTAPCVADDSGGCQHNPRCAMYPGPSDCYMGRVEGCLWEEESCSGTLPHTCSERSEEECLDMMGCSLLSD